MNVISGSILLLLLLVVCFAPRHWALLGFVAGVFFLTQGHSLDLAGLSLWPIRLLEMMALVRVIARGELAWSQLHRIDYALLVLYNYSAIISIIRSSEFSFRQVGLGIDPTFCYLAARGLIGHLDDFRWLLKGLAILLLPFAGLVLMERLTGQSYFTVVGASGQLYFRDGVPRAQGTFRHAILLGSVAAAFLSLYIGLWLGDSRRFLAFMGGGLCLFLVGLSNSGGPLTSASAVFLGWSIWALRGRMFLVRRALVGVLAFLLVFMTAPIWYLPFKISSIVGGGGYHRGLLMDMAWQNLDRWWFAGMDIQDTASWFPYVNPLYQGADITNQFVSFGITAGLAAVLLLIILLTFAFQGVGHALASVRHSATSSRADELLLWGLGVTLVVHVVSWLGVTYFDQSYVVWLIHLAAISTASQSLGLPSPDVSLVVPAPQTRSAPLQMVDPKHIRRSWVSRRLAFRRRFPQRWRDQVASR